MDPFGNMEQQDFEPADADKVLYMEPQRYEVDEVGYQVEDPDQLEEPEFGQDPADDNEPIAEELQESEEIEQAPSEEEYMKDPSESEEPEFGQDPADDNEPIAEELQESEEIEQAPSEEEYMKDPSESEEIEGDQELPYSDGGQVEDYQVEEYPQEGGVIDMKTINDIVRLKDDQVEALERRLDQQEIEMSDLRSTMSEMVQPESNQAQVDLIQEKQEKIAAEVADLNLSFDALAESKSHDETVQNLQDRVEEHDHQIAGCQSRLEELSQSQTKDDFLEPLGKRIEQQENEINSLKTALAAVIQSQSKKQQVVVLENRIQQQENEISDLNICLADMQKRLKDVEAALAQMSSKKSSSQQSLNHVQSSPKAPTGSKSRASVASKTKSAYGSKEDVKEVSSRKAASTEPTTRAAKKTKTKTKKTTAVGRQPSYNGEDGSVRIYLRGRPVVMYKPTDLDYDISQPGNKPDNQLALEWVYGYRGKDCRSNLHYLPNGEIAYFIAAVVVLYDANNKKQRHYLGHNDDVKCMAVHPTKTKIASGQVAGVDLDGKLRHPQVHVWDVETLTTLNVIQAFDRSVAALSFSIQNEGLFLCAIDETNDHVLSIWNWQKEKKIVEAKSSKDQVFGCEFNPNSDNSIVTYGKGHIAFWAFEGNHLNKKQGVFEKYEKPKFILSVAFSPSGEVLSGDSNGNIQVWGKASTKKIIRFIENAHDGPIFSIFANQEFFISAGKDGKIRKWNLKGSAIEQTAIPEYAGAVRMVSCNDEGRLLVGTRTNRILSGAFSGEFESLVLGHVEELWGLAMHPSTNHFITGAHDKHLVLWDTVTHVPLWSKTLEDSIQSAAFHPSLDNIVAVGMTTGRWVVIDTTNLEVIANNTDGPEQHDVIRYSPDGMRLAVGSHDNNIYVYNVSDDGRSYTKLGQCSGHSSYITHFDWSSDSQFIQSNSGDYELLYWDAQNCKQITSTSSMSDVQWDSQTCVLGFSVLGIWPEGADGTDINCTGRSKDQQLLATGDDFGKVHLFTYPCSQPRSDSRVYRGHSSHVTSVGFLSDNQKILTTGGQDCSIMQWQIV